MQIHRGNTYKSGSRLFIAIQIRGLFQDIRGNTAKYRIVINSRDPNQGALCKYLSPARSRQRLRPSRPPPLPARAPLRRAPASDLRLRPRRSQGQRAPPAPRGGARRRRRPARDRAAFKLSPLLLIERGWRTELRDTPGPRAPVLPPCFPPTLLFAAAAAGL